MRLMLMLAVLGCCLHAHSQNCSGYYFLQADKTIEMAIYNKKGDVTATQKYMVSNVSNSGDATTADISTEMVDKKGKQIAKGQSRMKCTGGVIMADMKMSMPMQPGQNYETDVKADDIYIEYPATMQVGDQLKDAKMHLDMNGANGMKQTVDMEVTDRKVEGKENVTTAAGSWDCYKITQKTKMRIKTMGIGMPMNIDATEWYAPGFGIVKTESKHGKTEIVSVK